MTKLNILPAPTFARLGVNYAGSVDYMPEKETITVREGEEQRIIQYRDTDCETNVTVEKNARLKLVQIFSGRCVSRLSAILAESSGLEVIQLYSGGRNISEIAAELRGAGSEFSADIGYDLAAGSTLDLNLIAGHYGRKTVSDIRVSGILRDDAEKVFKGTIDFRKGSSGAKGCEKEEVILMNEAVTNKTVPVILCAEEDVEGSHGATAGRIDERHVFYMRSRGIPEEKISEMITRAKLARIIGKIGDEQTEKRICGIFGWGDEVE